MEILSPFTISCQQGQSFPFYSIPNHPHTGLTPFLSDPPPNRGNVPLFIPNLWPNGQSWIESSSSCRWFWRGFWGGNFPGNRFDNWTLEISFRLCHTPLRGRCHTANGPARGLIFSPIARKGNRADRKGCPGACAIWGMKCKLHAGARRSLVFFSI